MNPWLSVATPHPRPAARLICFAHAGAGPSAFGSWSRICADESIEVVAVHLPGREARHAEPLPTELEAIVDPLAAAIAPLTVTGTPLALFGHSMGAILAFEVARRLRLGSAAQPSMVFVSGAPAPHLARTDDRLRQIADDTDFLHAVAAKYGGVPKIVLELAAQRGAAVAALRADLAITETYAYLPGAPLASPIVAYGGDRDPLVAAPRLDGWREVTAGPFASRYFSGDHFYLNRARDELIADIVARWRHAT